MQIFEFDNLSICFKIRSNCFFDLRFDSDVNTEAINLMWQPSQLSANAFRKTLRSWPVTNYPLGGYVDSGHGNTHPDTVSSMVLP
jgi:hypothetical protein